MIQPSSLLITGIAHLESNNNGDLHAPKTEGVFSEPKQRQIETVVKRLEKFKPTKIAVEWPKELNSNLNEEYQEYLKGNFVLTSKEVHQIGFRLAEKSGLNEVFAVDWDKDLPGVPDIETWTKEIDSSIFNQLNAKMADVTSGIEKAFNDLSFSDFLLEMNKPEMYRLNQEINMKLALVGTEKDNVGAMWTAHYWHYRNLLIYKNIVDLVQIERERIFVLYGFGHAAILQQFLQESGLFSIETVSNYL